MTLPTYGKAIENALANGYSVDPVNGLIVGLKGKPLAIRLHGTQRYPTVPLVVRGMEKRYYVVPAHKVMAFAIYGTAAFAKGIHVRHGAGGVLDIRASNLSLGSPSENESDKPDEVRSRVGKIARAAQGYRGASIVLTDDKLEWMTSQICYGPTGRVRRGLCTRWAKQFGVTVSGISGAIKSYKERSNEG